MKNIIFLFFFILGCGKTNLGTGASSSSNAISCKGAGSGGTITLSPMPTGANVMPVTLNGNYANSPMASVTICTPGTSTCTVVSDILVDTGSYGLRVFKSALGSTTLNQVTAPSGNSLAECAQFGIGSTWGPIKTAKLILGGEAAVTVPIQVIDSTFSGSGRPSICSGSDTTPSAAGYNGILGVGLFQEDCGSTCVGSAPNLYYSCSGTTCVASSAPLASQVVNPVVKLATDNNGVIFQMPSINNCGAQTVNGALILGIDTQSNNAKTSTIKFQADGNGEFTTLFNGITYSNSFIDSGSNGLFFPRTSALPSCTDPIQGSDISAFNCPYDTVSLTATQKSTIGGTVTSNVSFQINNAYNLFSTPNYNFKDLSANWTGAFNWGLPFFYGRKVYIGIDSKASTIGTGPYWAY